MNDNRMKRWMDAIDDDLLEEAQRPLPRGGAARRWGALAACFCAAALALALWQPWSAGIGDNTAGADADFGAMDKSFSVAMPPVLDAEPLSASLALPEGASLTSDYRWRQDGEGAVTGVSCTVLLDGYDYDYGAAYASQPLPAPDGTLPTDTYQVNGLTLLVYDDGAVGWYDTSAGIHQLLLAGEEGVTLRADFHANILLRRTCLNHITAGAFDSSLLIIGMDSFLHCSCSPLSGSLVAAASPQTQL